MKYLFFIIIIAFTLTSLRAQTMEVFDDFEGNGTITWQASECGIDTDFYNPLQNDSNPSASVMEYRDNGGQYANVQFEVDRNFDLSEHYTFTLKIYVPSFGITGNQPNQIALKLQDGTLFEPWSTQTEIAKSIELDQWQMVTFDFANDNYMNLDPNSLPPTQRTDLNRVVIQINGEDNNDFVLAYLDDVYYDGTVATTPVYDELVWSDEFETNGPINSEKWFHQTRLPAGGSWFNGELQHYTNRIENSFVEDGKLNIVAKKEPFTDQGVTKNYTSARLNSKFAFQYGKVEVRAKLPAGAGTWPAIWALGKNITEDGAYWDNQGYGTTPWPACGEIDIMEHWGSNQNYVQSAMHTPSSYGGTENHGGQTIPTATTEFHVYSLEWYPDKMVFAVDGAVHYTYQPEAYNADTWPFTAEQYLLLNIAIESSIDPALTEAAMEIDYVRVYQQSTVATNNPEPKLELKTYPNPVGDLLHVQIPGLPDQHVKVQWFNVNGQLVFETTKSTENQQLVLDNLSFIQKGMYFIRIVTEKDALGAKVVKL
ncbi:MAG: family 16 glycosylhydrolase [Salinivirgaceae bacterium]